MPAQVQTQTSTVPLPSSGNNAPELTVLSRVASIPMISVSLNTINETLIANAFTRSPYCTAKGLSAQAYHFTAPIQVRLAPLIVRADGIAHKAVDVVESRYPYPFKAKPEEVARLVRESSENAGKYVRERRESAVSVANKAIDEKVKSPVVHVAQGIDQRFTPIVDYMETAVTRLNGNEPTPTSPDTKYQYQRAYALSMSLKDHFYGYSIEQLKQLQAHNVLVRRASEAAHAIVDLASCTVANAHTRVHALSDTMIEELQKLQQSTHNLSCSLTKSLQSASAHQQEVFNELSSSLSSTITDVRGILSEPIPLSDKVARLNNEVKGRVSPLLERMSSRAGAMVEAVLGRAQAAKENAADGVNGHAKRQM